ncbi:MFS transporter [Streptomyces microflavus]|uniref:MFS transporter n=1 Tax=Streptomyces microflavus TaxID=1919 RepID=UPI00368C973A
MLGAPYVARLLGGTLMGRLPNAMAPIGILLWITGSGGTIAFGGLVAALYGLASALSQPVKGLLMDRRGQRAVHLPAAVLNSALLIALPVAGPHGGTGVAAALAIAAGLAAPPLEAGLRALWPSVLPEPRLRHVALALDTGTQGLLHILGPVLVAALASAHSPAVALATTAALGLAGTLVVATAPPSRHWRPRPERNEDGTAHRLSSGPLVALFAALLGVGFALGALTVWAVSMARIHHTGILSGLLPAAFSAGSFLGGLVYGRRTWPASISHQLLLGSTVFLAGWLPLLALPDPHAATVTVMLPGAALTVLVATAFVTTDVLAPAHRTSEAYAWLILSIGVGQAAGTALAGRLGEHELILPALPAAGALFTLAVLSLARPGHTPRPVGRHRRRRT